MINVSGVAIMIGCLQSERITSHWTITSLRSRIVCFVYTASTFWNALSRLLFACIHITDAMQCDAICDCVCVIFFVVVVFKTLFFSRAYERNRFFKFTYAYELAAFCIYSTNIFGLMFCGCISNFLIIFFVVEKIKHSLCFLFCALIMLITSFFCVFILLSQVYSFEREAIQMHRMR